MAARWLLITLRYPFNFYACNIIDRSRINL